MGTMTFANGLRVLSLSLCIGMTGGCGPLTVAHDPCATPDSRLYAVVRAREPMLLDGRLEEWTDACALAVGGTSSSPSGLYRLMWDDGGLWVAAEVVDRRLDAEVVATDGDLWLDDSLELMFDTLHDGGESMRLDDYKFLVNLRNVHADTRGVSWRDPDWDCLFESATVTRGTVNVDGDRDEGYVIEVRIPWSAGGITPPASGAAWGGDVVMNDSQPGGTAFTTAWSNPDAQSRTNVPSAWGTLVFVEPDEPE